MPTTRELLADRLNVVLVALGLSTTLTPNDICRVRAGSWQRARGAWSWSVVPFALGSPDTMGEIVAAPRLEVHRVPGAETWQVDVASRKCLDHPPPGAFLARTVGEYVTWYDRAGARIPNDAP